MYTLLLRLEGSMQSWGTTSRFDQRDTGKEPSKSGIIGLIAAAMGIDRNEWDRLEPITKLRFGVRHDRPGVLRRDYQTAGCAEPFTIIKANGDLSKDGVISQRYYLADAAFLVGLEGDDENLLNVIQKAIKNPKWVLALGRKSYLPAEPVYLKDGFKENETIEEAFSSYPLLSRETDTIPEQILCSLESSDGSGRMVMDQLLSSFAERRFGSRFVVSEWLSFGKEAVYVSS